MANPITILVNAHACPVKGEVYRVARRYGIAVKVVAGAFRRCPTTPRSSGSSPAAAGAADDWIAARAGEGVVVVTADVPLAARCVAAGAVAIGPTGREFTPAGIGMALAMRNLMEGNVRAGAETTGGPKPFSARDRSRFLSALDEAIVRLRRAGFA